MCCNDIFVVSPKFLITQGVPGLMGLKGDPGPSGRRGLPGKEVSHDGVYVLHCLIVVDLLHLCMCVC